MKSLPTLASALLIAVAPMLTACGSGGGGNEFVKPGEETAALAIWIWLAADQDTSVRCQGPFCTGGDSIYGFDPLLVVADNSILTARSYMKFTMPELPAGSEVEEAYLELYQTGGDAAAFGDNLVGVIPVEDAWRPDTMTYYTQPRSFPGQNEFNITPSSNNTGWWTSPNLKRYADYKLGNRQFNYGFVTTRPKAQDTPTAPSTSNTYRFASNNDAARTPTTIGRGPRFMLRVRLPVGATYNDVSLPVLPSAHDLVTDTDGNAARALMFTGVIPPASWNVGAGR